VNTSRGAGDVNGPWNSGKEWQRIDDVEASIPVDGGDGMASVQLTEMDQIALSEMASRTQSQISLNPTTGADLGAGPGAGRTKKTARS
jgi:Mn-containing catalase